MRVNPMFIPPPPELKPGDCRCPPPSEKAIDAAKIAGAAANQGRYKQAVAALTDAIGIYDQNCKLYLNRSHCHFELDDYMNAFFDAERAAELDKRGKCYFMQAKALHKLNRFRQAEAAAQKAMVSHYDSGECIELMTANLKAYAATVFGDNRGDGEWAKTVTMDQFKSVDALFDEIMKRFSKCNCNGSGEPKLVNGMANGLPERESNDWPDLPNGHAFGKGNGQGQVQEEQKRGSTVQVQEAKSKPVTAPKTEEVRKPSQMPVNRPKTSPFPGYSGFAGSFGSPTRTVSTPPQPVEKQLPIQKLAIEKPAENSVQSAQSQSKDNKNSADDDDIYESDEEEQVEVEIVAGVGDSGFMKQLTSPSPSYPLVVPKSSTPPKVTTNSFLLPTPAPKEQSVIKPAKLVVESNPTGPVVNRKPIQVGAAAAKPGSGSGPEQREKAKREKKPLRFKCLGNGEEIIEWK